MMSANMRLVYFAGRGRAELPRLILAAGKMPYENVRIPMKDWPKHKNSTPFGQVPVLEVDDVQLCQTTAISTFLAKKANLAGDNDLQQCQAEMVVLHCMDLMEKLFQPVMEKDKGRRLQLQNILWHDGIPSFLDTSEALLKQMGGKHFVANKLTYADIAVMEQVRSLSDDSDPLYTTHLKDINPDRVKLINNYPNLQDLVERVKEVPEIKDWLMTRPSNAEENF